MEKPTESVESFQKQKTFSMGRIIARDIGGPRLVCAVFSRLRTLGDHRAIEHSKNCDGFARVAEHFEDKGNPRKHAELVGFPALNAECDPTSGWISAH